VEGGRWKGDGARRKPAQAGRWNGDGAGGTRSRRDPGGRGMEPGGGPPGKAQRLVSLASQ
jgi:hypothetical protein